MKRSRIPAVMLSVLLLTGCAENPDSDIVVHKDMEALIGEAQQTDENKADIAELAEFDSYQADITNDSLRVTIHADAQVDIPETDKLSVFRVRQHDFTQDEIDKFRKALIGDTPLYDGTFADARTKTEIETEIQITRAGMAECLEQDPDNDLSNFQERLDILQEEYENAPDAVDLSAYPGGEQLYSVAERYTADPNNTYLQWQQGLNPDGELCYGVTVDNTGAFYVQNNQSYGNRLRYNTTPVKAAFNSVLNEGAALERTNYYDYAKVSRIPGIPENFLPQPIDWDSYDISQLKPIPNDGASMTQEEAEAQAEAFLQSVGLTDFVLTDGGKYAEMLDLRTNDGFDYYRTAYILQYARALDGTVLDKTTGSKFADEGSGDDYRKHMWPAEMIEIKINDAGIVEFSWNAPLEITETVVQDAAVKPFTDVQSTFERMLPITVTKWIGEEDETNTKVDIDRVTLCYSRISEKDSFDTGLIVPVWSFHGRLKTSNSWSRLSDYTGVQLLINAIDGSVIDPVLGY